MRVLEQFFSAFFRGPIHSKMSGDTGITDPWCGVATLSSGSAIVTVSSNLIQSNAVIMLTAEGATHVSSGYGPLEVRSLTHGTSFAITREYNLAMPRDTRVHWNLIRKPD